jgi:hypothetical protein
MRSHRFKSILGSLFLLCARLGFAEVVHAQSGGLALTHVTIIDPAVGKPQQDMTILVRGHDIAAVGRARRITIPASDKVIDGTGKFVIPGLIIDGSNSWSNPQFTISVTTADEARAAVVSLKQQGTDCIKVYDGLSRDSYFAILDEAKKLDLPVLGHLPSAISVREASGAGQQSLEHGIALAGGSTVEGDYMKRRLDQSAFQEALRTKNFGLIPAKIARDNTMVLDTFSQERADATYRLLAKNNTLLLRWGPSAR